MSVSPKAAEPEVCVDKKDAAAPQRRGRILRHASWLLYAAIVLCIAALVLVWLINLPHEQLPGALASTRQAANLGTLLQACLAMWVVLRWRRVVAWCRVKRILRKSEHRKALQLRRKAAGLLALYLLLIPIGPMALLRAAQSLFH